MWRSFEPDESIHAPRSGTIGPFLAVEAALDASPPGDVAGSALAAMAGYLRGLTAGDPALGRGGAVCPFMAAAIARGMVRLAACTLDPRDRHAALAAIDGLRRTFPPIARLDDLADPEMLRAVVVVFPLLDAAGGARFVEGLQRRLKAPFLAAGLMIGEFYPGCRTGGLHNPAFPALDAPRIALAVRRLSLRDAPFVIDRQDWLEAYLRHFGEAGRAQADRAIAARDARSRAA